MNINLKVEKKKVRLDQYLVENISGFSRTRIQNSIKNSEITINGENIINNGIHPIKIKQVNNLSNCS